MKFTVGALVLAHLAVTWAQKFQVQLVANTYENSTFNGYGLTPVYQNTSNFEGVIFLLGKTPSTFTYDNETQYATYTYDDTVYYLHVMNDYLVGFSDLNKTKETGSYNTFLLNTDGTLWVTKINNGVGYNLFYTDPTTPAVYDHNSYLSVYLLGRQTQPLGSQLFTVVYNSVGNSSNLINYESINGVSSNSSSPIASIDLLNSSTIQPTPMPSGTLVTNPSTTSLSSSNKTTTVTASSSKANASNANNVSFFTVVTTMIFSILASIL